MPRLVFAPRECLSRSCPPGVNEWGSSLSRVIEDTVHKKLIKFTLTFTMLTSG